MAAMPGAAEQHAVTRACTHNLAIYAPDPKSDTELNPVLAELSIAEPGRVFLMTRDPEPDSLHAYVSAQCHLTSGKRQQVCSEQIVVKAGENETANLPSLVIPLIVPDLPVYLWWRSDLCEEWQHFEEFVELADRVIVDSSRFEKPREALHQLLNILHKSGDATAFSDLNWNRLTPLREITAGFFDHPEARALLPAITSVDIQTYSGCGYSTQAFLYTGWLASRLQWRSTSNLSDSGSITMDSQKGPVRVSIFARSPGQTRLRGITSVTLRCEQPQASFHVSFDHDTRYLRGTSELPGVRIAERTMRAELGTEEECMASEMALLGHDRIYEQTMQAAAALL
jgi:glucose-6-phosphate dehydrogenase assembly protein OpcA